jgi:dissimilatory sulfite reductase related protein
MITANTLFSHIESLTNPDGFFRDPKQWNEHVAGELALRDGLPELTGEHWVVIHALREHFRRFGAVPPAFCHICHETHLGPHCVERLFHGEREAWRIAGLPDPGEEARAYM